jgi:hypothetical protein
MRDFTSSQRTATVEIIDSDFSDWQVPYFGRTCCLQVQNRKIRISNLGALHSAVLHKRLYRIFGSEGSVNEGHYRLRRKDVQFR